MGKRITLRRYEIEQHVLEGPGAYLLIGANDYVIYVGRSDTNLRSRLLDHLPGIETNPCIAGKRPAEVYFENTADAWAAYRLECEWYRKYDPPCNDIAPSLPEN